MTGFDLGRFYQIFAGVDRAEDQDATTAFLDSRSYLRRHNQTFHDVLGVDTAVHSVDEEVLADNAKHITEKEGLKHRVETLVKQVEVLSGEKKEAFTRIQQELDAKARLKREVDHLKYGDGFTLRNIAGTVVGSTLKALAVTTAFGLTAASQDEDVANQVRGQMDRILAGSWDDQKPAANVTATPSTSADEPIYATVAIPYVNVSRDVDATSPVIASLAETSCVRILDGTEIDPNWLKVQFSLSGSMKEGYMYGKGLRLGMPDDAETCHALRYDH